MTKDEMLKAALLEKAKREKARRAAARTNEANYAPEGTTMNEAGQMVTPQLQSGRDQAILDAYPVASRVQEFVQGTPIVGEYADEIVGTVNPQAADNMRAVSDAFERQRPGEAAALNVAGGIAMTAPYAIGQGGQAVANFIGRGRGLLGKGLRAGVAAAPAGAVEGAASFSGRAEPGQRVVEGAKGAAFGAGLATALAPIATLVGAGAADLARRVKKLDVQVIADEFGLSKPAARVMRSALANDDLDAAAQVLARGGDDAMLADAGVATRQQLDTAMSTGGEALAVARPRVNERVAQAGRRLSQTLDDTLGAPSGPKAATRAIAQRTSKARKAAYDFAYGQPTPMTGTAGRAIDEALARIDPDTMRAALKEAQAEMLDAGYQNQNIIASIADDGTVTFSQPLSVLQLDYIARGLGNVADAGVDKVTGAVSPAARRAMGQAKALRDALKSGVKGYSRALKLGGDAIAEREALMMGRNLFRANTSFEDVADAMRGASDATKAAARQGLRQHLDDVMSRARTTITDIEQGNFDFTADGDAAREAFMAIKALGSRDALKKMRVVLGSDATRLQRELQKTGDALALRAAVAKNSATASRLAGQREMAAQAAPGVARQAAGDLGNPLEALRGVTRAAAGTDDAALIEAVQTYSAEIADALTRIRGPEAQRALEAVRQSMAGQPIRAEQARLIGRVVAGAAGVAGYREGQRLTGQRPR